jgi:DNA-directed RNA polymerase specialized sigma24 family protein
VVQQVFLKLLERQVSVPVMALAYLYRAVRNASLNLRRNLQRAVEIGDSEAWMVSPDGNAEKHGSFPRNRGRRCFSRFGEE